MATPAVLDIARLLAPISDDAPTGVDLREADDGAGGGGFGYRRLRDIRIAAREAEREAQTDDPAGQVAAAAHASTAWRELDAACRAHLAGTTKDLELACWLTEALVRTDGFAGLRDGFGLAAGLVERYWDTLHSISDADDPAAKGQPVARLIAVSYQAWGEGSLLPALRSVALTPPVPPGPFSYWQIGAALRQAGCYVPENFGRQLDRFVVPAALRAAFHAASPDAQQRLLADIAAAREATRQLAAALDARMRDDAPLFWAVQDTLEDIATVVRWLGSGLAQVDERRAAVPD